jgi:hypothetical protein
MKQLGEKKCMINKEQMYCLFKGCDHLRFDQHANERLCLVWMPHVLWRANIVIESPVKLPVELQNASGHGLMEPFRMKSFIIDFLAKLESFRMESFEKESFRKYFLHHRNLSEWNLLEGIFQKILVKKPESFRMESFRKNRSERNLS